MEAGFGAQDGARAMHAAWSSASQGAFQSVLLTGGCFGRMGWHRPRKLGAGPQVYQTP